jgi:hypothetical protein
MGSLSPDGTMVVGCEEGVQKCALFPLDGGPPRPIPGWEDGMMVALAWDPDGRSIYVSDLRANQRILRIRLKDGHTELWKEIHPADTANISLGGSSKMSSVVISPQTGTYAYSYERVLSELYLVEGLK